MNAYTNVVQLFEKLTDTERNILFTLLCMLDSRGDNYNGKSKALFHFLNEKDNTPIFTEVENHLYPTGGKSNFHRLLLRFSDKIEEAMLLDTNLYRAERYSELQRQKLKASKSLLKARMYMCWKQEKHVERLCTNVIEAAQKFEFMGIWLQALELLGELPFYVAYKKAGNKLEKQYTVVIGMMQLANEAERVWHTSKQPFLSNDSNLLPIEIKTENLQLALKRHYSVKADLHIRLLKARLTVSKKQYTDAKKLFKSAIDLITEKSYLVESGLICDARLNYAETLFLMCRFKDCIEECEIINALAEQPDESKISTLEIEFKARFYTNQYSGAQSALNTLLAMNGVNSEQRYIWRLWFSQLLIVNEKYAEAAELLTELIDQSYFIPKYGLCVIQMLVVATGSTSQKEKVVFHLSKWIRRFTKSEILTEREQKINLMLSELYSNEFNYKQTILKQPELLNWLREPGNWSIYSNELIRFEEWLIAMRTHSKLVISVPRYHADDLINVHSNNETQLSVIQ
jgi:tetratricopeptide (TPR) repeat protein